MYDNLYQQQQSLQTQLDNVQRQIRQGQMTVYQQPLLPTYQQPQQQFQQPNIQQLIQQEIQRQLMQYQQQLPPALTPPAAPAQSLPPGAAILSAIGGVMTEGDQRWLSANLAGLPGFFNTQDGKELVNIAISSYKKHCGVNDE